MRNWKRRAKEWYGSGMWREHEVLVFLRCPVGLPIRRWRERWLAMVRAGCSWGCWARSTLGPSADFLSFPLPPLLLALPLALPLLLPLSSRHLPVLIVLHAGLTQTPLPPRSPLPRAHLPSDSSHDAHKYCIRHAESSRWSMTAQERRRLRIAHGYSTERTRVCEGGEGRVGDGGRGGGGDVGQEVRRVCSLPSTLERDRTVRERTALRPRATLRVDCRAASCSDEAACTRARAASTPNGRDSARKREREGGRCFRMEMRGTRSAARRRRRAYIHVANYSLHGRQLAA